jgi:hypothetical protein
MPQRCASRRVLVLQNRELVQAVSVDGGKTVLAAFYGPVRLALDGGGYIEPNIPCVLLLDQTSVPARIYMADPTHKAEAAMVRASAIAGRDVHIPLPKGDRAGSTIAVPFQAAD